MGKNKYKGRAQENPKAMDKTRPDPGMSVTMPARHLQTLGGKQNTGQGNEPALRLTRSMPVESPEMVTVCLKLPSEITGDVHSWVELLQQIQQHLVDSNKNDRQTLGSNIQFIIFICEALDKVLQNTGTTRSSVKGSSRKGSSMKGSLEWSKIERSAEAYHSNIKVDLTVESQCVDRASEQEDLFKQICNRLKSTNSNKKKKSKVGLSRYAPGILFFIRAVAEASCAQTKPAQREVAPVHQPEYNVVDTGSTQSLSKPNARGKSKVGQAPTPPSSTGGPSRNNSAESGTRNNESKASRSSMKNLEERDVSLQRQANKIAQQQKDVDSRERSVTDRENKVRKDEVIIEEREYEVTKRENKVKDREREVENKEWKVGSRERDIQQQETQLKEMNKKQNRESKQGGNRTLEKHRDDRDRLNMELHTQRIQNESLHQRYRDDVDKLKMQLQELRVQNEDLRHRLSKEMGDKVAANESSVENISIKHRPMTITDAYTHFQSDEWLEAKECLDKHWSKSTEDNRLQVLSNVLQVTESTVKEALFQLSENLKRALLQPAKYAVRYMSPNRADHFDGSEQKTKDAESFTRSAHATSSGRSMTLFEGRKRSTISHGIDHREVPVAITNAIGDFLRVQVDNCNYNKLIELVTSEIKKKHALIKQFITHKKMESYIQAAVLLCWKMAIQRPPMTFDFTTTRLGDKLQELHWGSKDVEGADVIVVYPLLKHGEKVVSKGKIYVYKPEKKHGTKL